MPRPRRTQAERRETTERMLIETALKIAAERGFAAITCEAVGREAGLSRGLTNQRFGSKEGLLRAMLAHLENYKADLMTSRQLKDLPADEAILAYIDLHLDALPRSTEAAAYFVLLAGSLSDMPALKPAFAEATSRSIREIAALVRKGQREGAIHKAIAPAEAARTIFSMITGLGIQWLIAPSPGRLAQMQSDARNMVRSRLFCGE